MPSKWLFSTGGAGMERMCLWNEAGEAVSVGLWQDERSLGDLRSRPRRLGSTAQFEQRSFGVIRGPLDVAYTFLFAHWV